MRLERAPRFGRRVLLWLTRGQLLLLLIFSRFHFLSVSTTSFLSTVARNELGWPETRESVRSRCVTRGNQPSCWRSMPVVVMRAINRRPLNLISLQPCDGYGLSGNLTCHPFKVANGERLSEEVVQPGPSNLGDYGVSLLSVRLCRASGSRLARSPASRPPVPASVSAARPSTFRYARRPSMRLVQLPRKSPVAAWGPIAHSAPSEN